jgi:hypothetical protein
MRQQRRTANTSLIAGNAPARHPAFLTLRSPRGAILLELFPPAGIEGSAACLRRTVMQKLKLVMMAACLATGLGVGGAQAMPISNLAVVDSGGAVEQARWVCGPYRCWWRPNRWHRPYAYAPGYYFGPRRYYHGPRWRYYRRW